VFLGDRQLGEHPRVGLVVELGRHVISVQLTVTLTIGAPSTTSPVGSCVGPRKLAVDGVTTETP
jgi:hypothetical protein